MFPGEPRGPGEPAGPTLPDSPCYWTQRQLVLVKWGQRLGASHMKVFKLLEFGMHKYDIKLFHNFLNIVMGLTDDEISSELVVVSLRTTAPGPPGEPRSPLAPGRPTNP